MKSKTKLYLLVFALSVALFLLYLESMYLYQNIGLRETGLAIAGMFEDFWPSILQQTTTTTTTTTPQTVSESPEMSFELMLEPGWNMVSVPLSMEQRSVASAFGRLSDLWGWFKIYGWVNSSSGVGYYRPEQLHPENGYWIYTHAASTYRMKGEPVESYRIKLAPGWNIVGSAYSKAARVSVLAGTVCSDVYEWVPYLGYRQAPSIQPGQAVWVFSYGYSEIEVSADAVRPMSSSDADCGMPPDNPDFFKTKGIPGSGVVWYTLITGGAGGGGGAGWPGGGGGPAATTTTIAGPATTTTIAGPGATTTTTLPSTSCDCGHWRDEGCGQFVCAAREMYQSRSCNPGGCRTEDRCVDSDYCEALRDAITTSTTTTTTTTTTTSTTTTIMVPPEPGCTGFCVWSPAECKATCAGGHCSGSFECENCCCIC